jgi:transcriptional regulator GlxA family with amidase domain
MDPDSRANALQSMATECGYSSRKLAQRLGISQRQLQRLFKAELRCTAQSWLREQRLLAARVMLESSATVKEVAYALGFSQESQFCRDFRLRFGTSPSVHLSAASQTLRSILGPDASIGSTDPVSRPFSVRR